MQEKRLKRIIQLSIKVITLTKHLKLLAAAAIAAILFLPSFSAVSAAENGFWFASQVEFVSLYMYRGANVGDSPQIQPKCELGYKNFEINLWGTKAILKNQPFEGKDVAYDEVDWGFKYFQKTRHGMLIPAFTAYYCPYEGKDFFDFRGLKNGKARGAYTADIALEYNGDRKFPVKFVIDYAVHNNPERPLYAEASYVFYNKNFEIEPFIGFVKGMGPGGVSSLYQSDKNEVSFCNVGINVVKNIKITDDFSFPLTTALYIQPHTEQAYVIFKAKL